MLKSETDRWIAEDGLTAQQEGTSRRVLSSAFRISYLMVCSASRGRDKNTISMPAPSPESTVQTFTVESDEPVMR
jgi:hypothetical protein